MHIYSLSRFLRIGHIKIFHGHLMSKEEPWPAIYPAREVQFTTKHILTECRIYYLKLLKNISAHQFIEKKNRFAFEIYKTIFRL
ncbi:RNase H domain-containing protein [Aphis craccivora]|uniref:RNase H domain-containing protein n=1 Tax=Aphis craccivora TaxID=307492 RepID=A0A6G0ZKS9_APHCR|nr:RNase H domain-containing protein [Aphis craccivora]